MKEPLHSIGRAWRDRRGASAIEFAMIVPVLIGLYVGAVELGNALTINRRTSAIAATAADLVAQVKEVKTADLQDVVKASSSVMTPYSEAPLTIVVSSVVADQNNNGKVAWSCANKGSGRAKDSSYAVPAGLTQAELAKAVGTTQSVISQLEDAEYKGHSLTMLRRIAAALNTRVEIRLVPLEPS